MTELQQKILANLGSNTNSGVQDLSETAFIETEIRSLENGLRFHLYGTLLYAFIFIFQIFIAIKNWPEKGIIYLIIYLAFWLISLYFLNTWFNKKQRIKLLKLLLSTHYEQVNLENWVESNRQIMKGWFWNWNSPKSKNLEGLGENRHSKLMFFITQLVLVFTFTYMAADNKEPMVYGAALSMVTTIFTFLDWKLHTYLFLIKNLTFYSHEQVAFQP